MINHTDVSSQVEKALQISAPVSAGSPTSVLNHKAVLMHCSWVRSSVRTCSKSVQFLLLLLLWEKRREDIVFVKSLVDIVVDRALFYYT